MKKFSWILALLAALTMVFVGVGCGGGGSSGDDPVINYPVEHKFIQIPGRSQNWHSIDIRGGRGFKTNIANYYTADKSHTIEVHGYGAGISSGVFFGEAQGSQAAYGGDTNVTYEKGEFKMSRVFTWAEISKDNDIRIAGIDGSVKIVNYYEIKITDEAGKVVYQLSTDPDIQGKEHGVEVLTEGGKTTTWLIGALGGGSPDPKGIVIDPKVTGFVATTEITGVPTEALIGSNITLPTEAGPTTATYKDIEWAISDKGVNTGATLTANVVSGTTAEGTIKVQGTVKKGKDGKADYVSTEFSITIKAPQGILIEDFSDGEIADTSDPDTEYLGDNTWKLGLGYKAVKFGIDGIVDNANYSTVTITYISDANARFGFLNDGAIIEKDLAGEWISDGSYHGNWDLGISDPATQELTKVINIPDCGPINGFRFDSKDAVDDGMVNITIISVYFELKEACEVCGKTPCICFVPVTGINGTVPTAGYTGIDITLPTGVLPSNATNKTIVWTIGTTNPTGAKIEGGKIVGITSAGKIDLIGTIVNGLTETTDKVFNYEISVTVPAGAGVLFDMQDLTEAELEAYFAGSSNNRGKVTVTGTAGNWVVSAGDFGYDSSNSGGLNNPIGWEWVPITILRAEEGIEGDILEITFNITGPTFDADGYLKGVGQFKLVSGVKNDFKDLQETVDAEDNCIKSVYTISIPLTTAAAAADISLGWNFWGAPLSGDTGVKDSEFTINITSLTLTRE